MIEKKRDNKYIIHLQKIDFFQKFSKKIKLIIRIIK